MKNLQDPKILQIQNNSTSHIIFKQFQGKKKEQLKGQDKQSKHDKLKAQNGITK